MSFGRPLSEQELSIREFLNREAPSCKESRLARFELIRVEPPHISEPHSDSA